MTATITVVTANGIGQSNADLYVFLANIDSVTGKTATSFTGFDSTNQKTFAFTGTGLTYGPSGLTGGTLTGFTLTDETVPETVMTLTFAPGVSALAVMNAANAFLSSGFSNPAALNAIFRATPIVFLGNNGPDTFSAGKLADNLSGGAGDDTLAGRAGADTIDGGTNAAGGDLVDYSASVAGVTVTLGVGGTQTTGIGGDAAGDKISNIENIKGSNFADKLTGNELLNVISGGGGNDTIEGGAFGTDTLDGGTGVNTLSYAQNAASALGISLEFGSDSIGNVLSNFQNVVGSNGKDGVADQNDTTTANRIDSGLGDDTVEDHGGNDTLMGGTGGETSGDTLSYALVASHGVKVSLAVSTAQATGIGAQTISGFENLTGTSLDDTLTGSAAANTILGLAGHDMIKGGGGNDSIAGGTGNDTLDGGAGADTLDGGADGDTVSYGSSLLGVNVSLAAASQQHFLNGTSGALNGDAADDLLANFENIIGSAHADVVTGNASTNVVEGGLGADRLDGGANGSGGDTVSYAHSALGIAVNLGQQGTGTALAPVTTGAAQQGGDAAGDRLWGFENILGSAYADKLTGDAGNNSIAGGAGNDTIEGGAGADTLDGGTGINTLSYAHAAGPVVVNLATHSGPFGGGDADGDQVFNFRTLIGSDQGDFLNGDASANVLVGGKGNDVLEGGGGKDTLSGGLGADVFGLFGAADIGVNNAATISDFSHAQGDVIGIDLLTFGLTLADFSGANVSLNANEFQTVASGGATSAGIRFYYNTTTDQLFFDADGNAAGAAILVAKLVPPTTVLTALDIVVPA